MGNFGVWDYAVLAVVILVSSVVGLYHGWAGKRNRQRPSGEKHMHLLPVSLSLIVSLISGLALQGISAEIYKFGTNYMFTIPSRLLVGFLGSYILLPIFFDMKLTSSYEYLERRYHRKVRLMGSILFVLNMVVYLPVVIYMAAVALNQVSGINVHVTSCTICLVCVVYTAIGGLRAVIWTDVVQTLILFVAFVALIAKGTADAGGFGVIWDRALQGERLDTPKFKFDFTDRHSFWSVLIGAGVMWIPMYTINQNNIERYTTLSSVSSARKALWLFVAGVMIFDLLASMCGLLIYATYHDCDPLTTKAAKTGDQLLLLLVSKVFGRYPGLPGLFFSGLVCACLSTLSTGLNTSSSVVFQDFIKPNLKKPLKTNLDRVITGTIVVGLGLLCIALVFVIERMAEILQVALSLMSVIGGPVTGIFYGGVMLPWINDKGALFGGIIGICVSSLTMIGAQTAILSGALKTPVKPMSTIGCENLNRTIISAVKISLEEPRYVFPLYKMSYLWYSLYGATVTILSALLISYIWCYDDVSHLDRKSVSPWVRRFLPAKQPVNTIEMKSLLATRKKETHCPKTV